MKMFKVLNRCICYCAKHVLENSDKSFLALIKHCSIVLFSTKNYQMTKKNIIVIKICTKSFEESTYLFKINKLGFLLKKPSLPSLYE